MTSSSPPRFPCTQCAAPLVFAPGTSSLACPYCGSENAVTAAAGTVTELDYQAHLASLGREAETHETLSLTCGSCGAGQSFPPGVTASLCAFCGTPLVATARCQRLIRPRALLPFAVTEAQATAAFRSWVGGLWFAPNALVKTAVATGVKGVYVPAWTYDADTRSWYAGERGDDYWETESYAAREGGRTVTRTRQVRRTRWSPARGQVACRFDDVLVLASDSLPRRHAEALEPWDLGALVPYSDEYLSGFVAESYRVDLAGGYEKAQAIMARGIERAIRAHIGGDHQRIHDVATRHDGVTFKHVLLPAWISAYRYRDATYRFLVNARTAEVQGERPYSWIKIALFALALALVAILIVFLTAD